MTYAEKFLLYVGVYTGTFSDEISSSLRIALLIKAQTVFVRDSQISADEAALSFVLWSANLSQVKPSFLDETK